MRLVFNAVESLLTFDSGIAAMALPLRTRRARLYSEQMHGPSAEAPPTRPPRRSMASTDYSDECALILPNDDFRATAFGAGRPPSHLDVGPDQNVMVVWRQ